MINEPRDGLSEDMKKELYSLLKTSGFKDNDGHLYVKIDADYRDELSERQIKEILQSNDPRGAFYDIFDEASMYAQDSAFDWAMSAIKKEWDDLFDEEEYGSFDDYEDEVHEFISENVTGDYDYDHYLSQSVNAVLFLNFDANTDFSGFGTYAENSDGPEDDDDNAFVWLGSQLGYSSEQVRAALRGEDKSDALLREFFEEGLNTSSGMNAFVFCGQVSLGDFLSDTKPSAIKVHRGTYCGLFDAWNGAGSTINIPLPKDVVVPANLISSFGPDGSRGYGVDAVYGMSGGFWEDGQFSIIES